MTSEMSYHPTLVASGLSINQSKLYESLVRHGRMPASRAARLANVPRTLGYKTLQELQALELVEKEDLPGKVATFVAVHPFKLKEIVDKRYAQAKDSKQAIEGVIGRLIAHFNTNSGTPGLRVLEGVGGVAELYEDELNENSPIKLIRTPEDDTVPEIQLMVTKQIAEQVRLGIAVRVIAPHNPLTDYKKDTERLIERRILPPDMFNIPAQVAIYGNKVAITSYKPLITTIIENEPIRVTFEILFEYIWKSAEEEHRRLVREIVR